MSMVVVDIPALSSGTIEDWTSTDSGTRTVRYILKDIKDLGECFDPLIKTREKLVEELDKFRKETRNRGYLLVAGQIGTCVSVFLPFVKKNFKKNVKKFTGMSLYLFFVVVVGLLIAFSLWHLLKHFKNFKNRLDTLMVETDRRVRRYRMVLKTDDWVVETKKPAVAAEEGFPEEEGVPAAEEEVLPVAEEEGLPESPKAKAKVARMGLEDELVLIKIREICAKMDYGLMGKKLVWIEMGVASFILISIIVAATVTRLN